MNLFMAILTCVPVFVSTQKTTTAAGRAFVATRQTGLCEKWATNPYSHAIRSANSLMMHNNITIPGIGSFTHIYVNADADYHVVQQRINIIECESVLLHFALCRLVFFSNTEFLSFLIHLVTLHKWYDTNKWITTNV